jgi:hypothetical protein
MQSSVPVLILQGAIDEPDGVPCCVGGEVQAAIKESSSEPVERDFTTFTILLRMHTAVLHLM